MPARASPSSFAVHYHFSISITGGFAFEHIFIYDIIHLVLKGLTLICRRYLGQLDCFWRDLSWKSTK